MSTAPFLNPVHHILSFFPFLIYMHSRIFLSSQFSTNQSQLFDFHTWILIGIGENPVSRYQLDFYVNDINSTYGICFLCLAYPSFCIQWILKTFVGVILQHFFQRNISLCMTLVVKIYHFTSSIALNPLVKIPYLQCIA